MVCLSGKVLGLRCIPSTFPSSHLMTWDLCGTKPSSLGNELAKLLPSDGLTPRIPCPGDGAMCLSGFLLFADMSSDICGPQCHRNLNLIHIHTPN